MDRRTGGSTLVIAGSLVVATGAAALTVALTRPGAPSRAEIAEELPHAIELPDPPVVAARDRTVPPNVLATAHLSVSGRAPGLSLERVILADSWEENRAEIRDLTTGDLRAYAIGDLLPHGSLLVGLSTGTADIMVGDIELVRLAVGRAPQRIHDFRTFLEAQALKRAPDLERDYLAAIKDSVRTLGMADSETVQAHLDELIRCGDPAVEVLIHYVGDEASIAPGPYQVPAGSGVTVEPRIVGDAVIAVLESITGQTFGDPTRTEGADRDEITRAWQRWWGL